MSTNLRLSLPDGRNLIFKGVESIEAESTTQTDEDDFKSWSKESVYGIESVSIDQKSMECDVKYSVEKFFGNKKDKSAPPAGKMRITWLGNGTKVVFADGSTEKNDVNAIFSSPYIKSKIEEFNNYYIKEKGYQPFTQEDAKTFKMDIAQILRKVLTISLVNKTTIRFFNGTAIYGLFDHIIGTALDKIFNAPGGAEGGVKSLIFGTPINTWIPFCIVYTHTDESGKKRVIVKRFLYSGVFTKNISKIVANSRSGGKEIGTVQQ
jgi:hypothetical protein